MARPDRSLPDHGLPDDELPDRALLERIWRILSRWAVPVMMTLAYVFLAATSETNNTGRAWMGVGLVFVLVVWFMFRRMTETAALARAFSIGDTTRLLELADYHLPRKRRPSARAPFLVARAFAHRLRGELVEALAALEDAHPGPELQPLASAVRIGVLVELGRPADEARTFVVSAPRAPALVWLAEGQIAWRDGDLDTASQQFARVIDDMRAGSASRAIAHVYAARIADARGDPQTAVRHRATAASLAAPDASWLRGQPAPPG
jgi:hypothetical protein